MNLNDFRDVVFEAKIGKQIENDASRWVQMSQLGFQIVQFIAYLFVHVLKRFEHVKPPRN